MTLSKKHIAYWIGLLAVLLFLITKCTSLYWQRNELTGRLILKTEAARKDSVKAVQKDIALKNVVHPEQVIVDSARGMVYLAIRNDQLSDKPLPVIESSIPDTISLSANVKTTYRTVTDTSEWVKENMNRMQVVIDSLLQVIGESANTNVKAKDTELLTLIKPKPAPYFDPPYVLGKTKGDQSQLPKLQINAAIQVSHRWPDGPNLFGIGSNVYWRHLRFYNGLNINSQTGQIGGTSSLGFDFFNLYKSKK